MKNRFRFIGLCLILACVMVRCQKIDLAASYIALGEGIIQIDMTNFDLEHGTYYDEATLRCIQSQKFPDAWVFVNGVDMGTWELPCEIPILAEGPTNVTIYPGVKMNGVSTSRPRYPFVEGAKLTLDLEHGKVTTIDTVFVKYAQRAQFNNVLETFETNYNQYFEATDSAGINFQRVLEVYDPARHHQVGVITLPTDSSEFNIQSQKLAFSWIPSAVFMEMDFRCDNTEGQTFNVGMLIEQKNTPIIAYEPLVVVNTSNEWKKIYINLTQSILRNQQIAKGYRILLSGGNEGDTPINLYFDNIKVVYI